MPRRLLPGGLRSRLVLAISLITAFVVGFSFVALHQGTGADLEHRIDDELRGDFLEFEQGPGSGLQTPAQLERAARRFIAGQGYHAASRVFLIEVTGRREVTNQQEIVEREAEREAGSVESEAGEGDEGTDDEPGLLQAPSGLATVSTEDTGPLRVYTQPIEPGGERLGTFRVAEPLEPVEQAQSGLRQTFLVVGVVALIVAVAAAFWVATLIARPLHRMARFASAVDAGDLTRRIQGARGADEVRVLTDAFNHMLDRLEAAFRNQRAFVADASHELRTPLTVLRGEIELLAREQDEPDALRETSEKLLKEVERMNRLVNDMLTLAAAESGGLLHRDRIDLDDFFADLRRDLPLLGARDYRIDGAAGVLDADPDRLAQVLRNLVRNAVAHTNAGGRIAVAATPDDGKIEFSVSDTGTGIPSEHLHRLFDRFYRTDVGRARAEGGSGLGLAIARAIVEAHGGRIWAESEPGQGTAIRFELPGYSMD